MGSGILLCSILVYSARRTCSIGIRVVLHSVFFHVVMVSKLRIYFIVFVHVIAAKQQNLYYGIGSPHCLQQVNLEYAHLNF